MHSRFATHSASPPLWQYQLWLPIISHRGKKVITYPLRRKLLFILPLLFRLFPPPFSVPSFSFSFSLSLLLCLCAAKISRLVEKFVKILVWHTYLSLPSPSYFNTCCSASRLFKPPSLESLSSCDSSIDALGLIGRPPRSTIQRACCSIADWSR